MSEARPPIDYTETELREAIRAKYAPGKIILSYNDLVADYDRRVRDRQVDRYEPTWIAFHGKEGRRGDESAPAAWRVSRLWDPAVEGRTKRGLSCCRARVVPTRMPRTSMGAHLGWTGLGSSQRSCHRSKPTASAGRALALCRRPSSPTTRVDSDPDGVEVLNTPPDAIHHRPPADVYVGRLARLMHRSLI